MFYAARTYGHVATSCCTSSGRGREAFVLTTHTRIRARRGIAGVTRQKHACTRQKSASTRQNSASTRSKRARAIDFAATGNALGYLHGVRRPAAALPSPPHALTIRARAHESGTARVMQ